MAMPLELFRFAVTRRPNRAVMGRIDDLLIRDERAPSRGSLRSALFGPGDFEPKLARANAYAASGDYLTPDSPLIVALEPFVAFLRKSLVPGAPLADLVAAIRKRFPLLARLLQRLGPDRSDETIDAAMFSIFDSLYAETIRGCDRYVSTNHLIDALRAYRVLALLVDAAERKDEEWTGGAFDDYDALIDLQAAAAGAEAAGDRSAERLATAIAPLASFRVPLSVGAIKPPVVGDLLLVEQELRRYVLGELASAESIMRGERRERTVRGLSRTTRVQLDRDAAGGRGARAASRRTSASSSPRRPSRAPQESLGIQAGVNVTGKYGPVQVSASVNAAFNTSSSTSDSTSQEYAKSITEEASESVRNSIKTTSSVTVLSEAEDTSLRGWNNETGTEHVNGLYRWIDKVYDASLRNYGRRLMLSLAVPEPSAFYRGLLQQQEAAAVAELEEPVGPSRIDPNTLEVLPEDGTGFNSFRDLDERNYARLAARYDVAVDPPPSEFLTGSKTIVHPDAMQAKEMPEHDHPNDLSLVLSDSTLTVAPGYRVTTVGVLAPAGTKGGLKNWADALKLGEDQAKVDDANVILVQVAGKSFSVAVHKDPDDNAKKVINTDFNTYKPIDDVAEPFGGRGPAQPPDHRHGELRRDVVADRRLLRPSAPVRRSKRGRRALTQRSSRATPSSGRPTSSRSRWRRPRPRRTRRSRPPRCATTSTAASS